MNKIDSAIHRLLSGERSVAVEEMVKIISAQVYKDLMNLLVGDEWNKTMPPGGQITTGCSDTFAEHILAKALPIFAARQEQAVQQVGAEYAPMMEAFKAMREALVAIVRAYDKLDGIQPSDLAYAIAGLGRVALTQADAARKVEK